ncbi:hypothetical protein EW146_g5013 [Bondarzewia mesenterica]|uniref:THO1-MOS11 C-terminal domain-containing protein n=1 Tax=Bondarzewia mesenterica TaxID=1095465 RepID=A0A4S4LST4_9AGAM|nr:hypothetical protein EW146_g5013 [Bondarzewia mesenterica]
MESKLKALKVVDLRDILVKAAVSAPAKAPKSDLIAKILASPAALDTYNQKYPSASPLVKSTPPPAVTPIIRNDDLLAPPEEVDWNVDDTTLDSVDENSKPPTLVASPQRSPVVPPKTAPSSIDTVSNTEPTPAATANPAQPAALSTADEELEKRKKRAARFGIPLVEVAAVSQPRKKGVARAAAAAVVDGEKLRARAEKFGTGKPVPAAAAAAPPQRAEARCARRRGRCGGTGEEEETCRTVQDAYSRAFL